MPAYKKVSRTWLRGVAAACLTLSGIAEVLAETLLIVRPETDMLEFVDPGSGLRLATVAVGSGPRRIAVAPDGKRAAIVNCRTPTVTLSIVDLENPREMQRTPLPLASCPAGLTWFAADRIAVAVTGAADSPIAIETDSGRSLGPLSADDQAVMKGLGHTTRAAHPDSVAVQQFIAAGGQLDQLAVTPVLPRATCHACTAKP